MFKRFKTTRQRVILSSILVGIISFLLISPSIKIVTEYLLPPSEVKNLTVAKTSIGEITLNWDLNDEYDIKGYKITKDGEEQILASNVDNYVVTGLEQLKNYAFSIEAFDTHGNVSNPLQFRYSELSDSNIIFNRVEEQPFSYSLIVKSGFMLLVIFLLSSWSLFYKYSRRNILTIVMLPGFLYVPYLLLSLTTIATISSNINKIIISGGLSLGILVISYISILTANILNAASVTQLPLEQAGKATQFILSLVSTYLILIFAFGTYQNMLFRLVVLLPFIYIYTYAGLIINKNSDKDANVKSIGITLMVLLSTMVASVWPVEVAYSILMIAIIYYILLNLALELRTRYTRALWVEYSILLLLVLILFFSTSAWGINFSII